MKEFEARNAKQLDLCLKLLYAEKVQFSVTIRETDKRKIMYVIHVQAEDHICELLREKYRILIS